MVIIYGKNVATSNGTNNKNKIKPEKRRRGEPET
jgi:hypothetical protein